MFVQFQQQAAFLTWYAFKENDFAPKKLYDPRTEENYIVGKDHEYLIIEPYGFHIMENT